MSDHKILIRFSDEHAFTKGARELAQKHVRLIDAYTPIGVAEVAALISPPNRKVQVTVILAAVGGIAAGYFLQYYANAVSYPVNVGGRPLNSVPAFLQVTFESMVLFGAFAALAALLWLIRLPLWHQEIFELPSIRTATHDQYLLLVEGREDEVARMLQAYRVEEVRTVHA